MPGFFAKVYGRKALVLVWTLWWQKSMLSATVLKIIDERLIPKYN
jgi:hypothetical protein